MKIFPVIIRRIEQGAGIIASVVSIGLSFTKRFAYDALFQILGGFSFSSAVTQFINETLKPSFQTSLLEVNGTLAQVLNNVAVSGIVRINQQLTDSKPAADIVQATYSLSHRSGSNAATQVVGACNRTDFTDEPDAQGIHNGVNAFCQGNALGARCGRLNLAYANFPNKTELTITQVNLHFYYLQNSVLSGTSTGGYNFGAADTQLFSNPVLTSPDFLVSPQTFDITAAIAGSWTNLDNLRSYVIAEFGLGAINDIVRVDAVELEVIANKTDTF